MNQELDKSIVLFGEGPEVLLAALFLLKKGLATKERLKVIKRSQEETVPARQFSRILQTSSATKLFHSDLQISEVKLVAEAGADIQLGIEYISPNIEFPSLLYCESQYGIRNSGSSFGSRLNAYQQSGKKAGLEDFNISAKLARKGRFTPPSPNPKSVYSSILYGYRMHSEAYERFLEQYLRESGLVCKREELDQIQLDEKGFIKSLIFESGMKCDGEIFFDLSRERKLIELLDSPDGQLPNKSLGIEVNQAVVKTKAHQCLPYSSLMGGAGYLNKASVLGQDLFSHTISIFSDDDSAKPDHSEVESLWYDGHPWQKNCVALGPAVSNKPSIFIDNIEVLQSSLLYILELWPRTSTMDVESKLFNKKFRVLFEKVWEIDSLHFGLLAGDETVMTEEAGERLSFFKKTGRVLTRDFDLVGEYHWPILFECLGVKTSIKEDSVSQEKIPIADLSKLQNIIEQASDAAPKYESFLQSIRK